MTVFWVGLLISLVFIAAVLQAGCARQCVNERSMACMSADQIERELSK